MLVSSQGEWKPKQVDNPNFKGVWVHPEVDNPEYTADGQIYKFDKVGVLGLDLWQVCEGKGPRQSARLLKTSLTLSPRPTGEVWHHL